MTRFVLCKYVLAVAAFCMAAVSVSAGIDSTKLRINGTVRAKYEYKYEEGLGRFMVRNARVGVSGELLPVVSYKAEIDLCDEGQIKMLDAYMRLRLLKGLDFTIGQMRVPFTIDAHRSPHEQYFANRSFIAKQVANIRDVGAQLSWNFGETLPIVLTAGVFNGSGLTNQKDYWRNGVDFSGKVEANFNFGLGLVIGAQKIRPDDVNIVSYSAGAFYDLKGLHLEAEYLQKTYTGDAFPDVHSFNGFASYAIPLAKGQGTVRYLTPLVRFDTMSDHSDGIRYLDGVADSGGSLIVGDYARSRLTGGLTLSLARPFACDIRLNYENYFYRDGAEPDVSERDKIVIEFMVRF